MQACSATHKLKYFVLTIFELVRRTAYLAKASLATFDFLTGMVAALLTSVQELLNNPSVNNVRVLHNNMIVVGLVITTSIQVLVLTGICTSPD